MSDRLDTEPAWGGKTRPGEVRIRCAIVKLLAERRRGRAAWSTQKSRAAAEEYVKYLYAEGQAGAKHYYRPRSQKVAASMPGRPR